MPPEQEGLPIEVDITETPAEKTGDKEVVVETAAAKEIPAEEMENADQLEVCVSPF